MVKNLVMLVAVAAMFVSIDSAQARGRRGGCPGGVCYTAGSAPAKSVVAADPAAQPAVASAPATPVVAAQPAPRYTATRRFFWRR